MILIIDILFLIDYNDITPSKMRFYEKKCHFGGKKTILEKNSIVLLIK
jgi:hypothetical protein